MSCAFSTALQPSWDSASGYVSFHLEQSKLIGNDLKDLNITKRVASYMLRFFIAIPLAVVTVAIDFTWCAFKISLITIYTLVWLIFWTIQVFRARNRDFSYEASSFLRVIMADFIASIIFPIVATGYALKGKIAPTERRGKDGIFYAYLDGSREIDLYTLNTSISHNDFYIFKRIISKLSPEMLKNAEFRNYSQTPFSSYYDSPLFRACQRVNQGGDTRFLKILLKKGFQPVNPADHHYILLEACRGHLSKKALLPKELDQYTYEALDLLKNNNIKIDGSQARFSRKFSDGQFIVNLTLTDIAIGSNQIGSLSKLLQSGCTIDQTELKIFRKMVEIMQSKRWRFEAPSYFRSRFYSLISNSIEERVKQEPEIKQERLIDEDFSPSKKESGKEDQERSCHKNLYYIAWAMMAPSDAHRPNLDDLDKIEIILQRFRDQCSEKLKVALEPKKDFPYEVQDLVRSYLV